MGQDSMEKAKAFIQAHLTVEWSLEMLAKEVGYSPYHFARLFRKAAGRSVMDYVRESGSMRRQSSSAIAAAVRRLGSAEGGQADLVLSHAADLTDRGR